MVLPEALLRDVRAQPSERKEPDSQSAVCQEFSHSDIGIGADGYEEYLEQPVAC